MATAAPTTLLLHPIRPTNSLPPPTSFSLPSSYRSSDSPPTSSKTLSTASRGQQRRRNPRIEGMRMRVSCSSARQPLKVMISGAPASGKGTQCAIIVEKYGLVHVSTGDLLRAEVAAGSEIGKKAKEYMNKGHLVPDEIVTDMVVSRLSKEDVREKGWLLDGYPRSFSQAQSLEKIKIRPDIYIMLDVPDEILIDRCIGRRMDPVTGKIYHLTNFPPETEEIAARLITRPDDTEEKAKSRLETYKQNTEAILSTYSDLLNKVDGNRSREVVYSEIDSLLQRVQEKVVKADMDNCKGQ